MYDTLIIAAFEKAGANLPGKSSTSNRADRISDWLLEEHQFRLSSRSLRDWLKMAKEEPARLNPNAEAIELLARYLGYRDYKHYLKEQGLPVLTWLRKNRVLMVVAVIGLVLALYFYSTRTRWMEWREIRYVEVGFDAKKLQDGTLKLYNSDRIEGFRKLSVNCDYPFFNHDKSPRVWYGKNTRGQYEYFSSLGLHPETGKTLKPITRYIIDKWVCGER